MEDHHPPSNGDDSAPIPGDGHAQSCSIEVDYDRRINYSMQQNDVPVVKLLRITNHGSDLLQDLVLSVWIDHDLAPTVRHRIARIGGGETWNVENLDLPLDPAVLLKQVEREASTLHVEVRCGEDVLCQDRLPIETLAYNEWGGLGTLPEILAAFVLPNQTVVEQILGRVRDILESHTQDGSLSGYQSGVPNRVRQIAHACYMALQEMDIGYINPPASFEGEGQKIRAPGQIAEMRLGTCLDLALLHAACLEQCGLHPLILIVEGHAFAGVWTTDNSFSEPAMDDAAGMRKRVQLGDIVAYESTAVTTKPSVSFDDACRVAMRHLEDSDRFLCAVDIRAARKLRIRPLPLRSDGSARDSDDAGAEVAVAPRSSDLFTEDGHPRRWDDAPATGIEQTDEKAEGPVSRLETWKRKLLDLGLRNRLLNFRDTKKTVPLFAADLGALEDALAAGRTFSVFSRPELSREDGPRNLEAHRERTQEDALTEFVCDDLKDNRLRTRLSEAETETRLLTVYRSARNDLEETGANTLFLAVGFLSWYEADSSTKERLAPILLLPLEIIRKSVQEGFRIRLSDDDPRINITLLEKLSKDFNINTSGLDSLPSDDSGLDVDRILQGFRRAILDMKRWDIQEKVEVGLFSFNTFLMWKDLQEHTETLMESSVVRHLVEKPGESFGDDGNWPEPEKLDDERPVADTLCPLDADSSQLAAIFAAHDGRTFVLQGPPGTGKSQTITNLIAHALGHGKRVLFVAEKRAALNVVHDRLQRVGLLQACLEVHSNKANKRDVLKQIEVALDHVGSYTPPEWAGLARSLEEHRGALNRYVEEIHKRQKCGWTLYQATAKLIELKDAPRLDLELGDVTTMDPTRLKELNELLVQLETAADAVTPVKAHPLRAVEIDEWRTAVSAAMEMACTRIQSAVRKVAKALSELGQIINGEGADRRADSLDLLQIITELCKLLLDTPGPELALLTEPGWEEIEFALRDAVTIGCARDVARDSLLERFAPSFLDEDATLWLARWSRATASIAPLSWLRKWGLKRDLKRFVVAKRVGTREIGKILETLAEVHERTRVLSEPQGDAARLFGRHWRGGAADWSALSTQIEWAGHFRSLLVRLRGIDAAVAESVSDRLMALATNERDLVDSRGPHREKLEQLLSAWSALERERREAEETLSLNPAVAWGRSDRRNHLGLLYQWAKTASEHRGSLRDWCHWRRMRATVSEAGMASLVAAAETDTLASTQFRDVFDRAFLERFVGTMTDDSDLLRHFNSHEHERRIEAFRKLDRKVMNLSREVVRARLAENVPHLTDDASEKSEVGILKRQLKLKRRHMPIRKLFESLPYLLPRLKPCLLMSPLSVAQYLSPDYPRADLVIFDEASQIPVWNAIGALARGNAAVVVGDSKQLPPTIFFRRMDDGDDDEVDDDTVQDLESILDECEASGLKRLHLNWHYRSRHESLIAFSNHQYYDNRLHTFPSAAREVPGLGVSLKYLAHGVYDRGKSATNKVEAEAIRDALVRRLTSHQGPDDPPSIGIVAFSQVQQNLIEDLLDAARREHPEIERFFGDQVDESVFVKNLENVQGDERDIILFSICYGPDRNGKVTMNFGPLNRQGGERRLNVAITRARREVVVFTSLRPDQIDLRRTRAPGVEHLKVYLDYAERGPSAIAEAATLDPEAEFDSPFENEVHDALTSKGYDVDIQVGCSGYRIDLAIRDPDLPGRYVLGVECDGATYHSAASARDRDRLRQAVLESLGWKIHRIWSTDWLNDPRGQIERLERAIEVARREVTSSPRMDEDDEAEDAAAEPESQQPEADRVATPLLASMPDALNSEEPAPAPAQESSSRDDGNRRDYPLRPQPPNLGVPEEFYEPAAIPAISQQILDIVESESPLHFDTRCRRVLVCWSLGKIGSRIRKTFERALSCIPPVNRPVQRGLFVWSTDQDPNTWRIFRVPNPSDPEPRKAEEICPVEIANAATFVLERQVALPVEDLGRETARIFGITRFGKNVSAQMQLGIDLLEGRGDCTITDGTVTLAR